MTGGRIHRRPQAGGVSGPRDEGETGTPPRCQGRCPATTPARLFLLGGDIAVFELMADAFLAAAGGADARLAILLIGGEGWERHQPGYAGPWQRRGVQRLQFIVPDLDGLLDTARAVARVREATGLIVGGGDTRRYHRLYATEPMRTAIREQVGRGVPYAGLSAGALLTPDTCVARPDAGEQQPAFLPGLGLLPGLALGVHYDREGQPDLLRQAMAHTGAALGLGLAERSCALLVDGKLSEVFGEGVHQVTADGPSVGGIFPVTQEPL